MRRRSPIRSRALDTHRRTATGIVARWRHADGEYRWLEGNLLALIGRDGTITGYRGTHRDVTERKQQQERITRLTRVLQFQSGINAAVVRIRDRDALLREACRLAITVGGYDHTVVSMVTADGRHVVPWYWNGGDIDTRTPVEFEIGDGLEPDSSLVGRALRTGEIAVANDLSQSEPVVANRVELMKKGYRSMVALPFIVDGSRVGALTLCSRAGDLVSDEELRLLQEITANLSFALQFRQKEDAFQLLAYFDPLTGLAKRALFCERLDELLIGGFGPAARPVVVAFDVDRLSHVNDSFGRHVGDLLLQKVSERVKHQVDDDDRLGYLGGGTFADGAAAAGSVGRERHLPSSIPACSAIRSRSKGTRCACRSSPASRATRASAKTATHSCSERKPRSKQAKTSGEQYLHYQIQMHSELAERLSLEHRLRTALDEEQFVLYYQPQVNVHDGPHRRRRGAAALAGSARGYRRARAIPAGSRILGNDRGGWRMGSAQGGGRLSPLAAARPRPGARGRERVCAPGDGGARSWTAC